MPAMVDSCVLLDVFTRDQAWRDWSERALAEAANEGMLVVNPAIYAEVSTRFEEIELLDSALDPTIFQYRPTPKEAAFLAGKCFLEYRRRGGRKTSPLPDFLIGAHAAVQALPLITRDAKRFRGYFPSLKLVEP